MDNLCFRRRGEHVDFLGVAASAVRVATVELELPHQLGSQADENQTERRQLGNEDQNSKSGKKQHTRTKTISYSQRGLNFATFRQIWR